MYAILVDEPGGEPASYVLSTAARTPESAMQVMSSRAEEYVEEQLEQSPDEDYTITPEPDLLQVTVFFNSVTYGPQHSMTLSATAIDQVV